MLDTLEKLANVYGFQKNSTYNQTRYEDGHNFIIVDHQTKKITFYGNYSRLIKKELIKTTNN